MLAGKKDSRIGEKQKIVFLFPPIKKNERVGQGINQERNERVKRTLKRRKKKSLHILELLFNIHISGFAFTFVGYF